MSHTIKRFLLLVSLNFVGAGVLLLPLVGIALSLRRRNWILVILCILAFFLFRRLLWALENRVGVSSLSNPQASSRGSGLTMIAPWLRTPPPTARNENCDN